MTEGSVEVKLEYCWKCPRCGACHETPVLYSYSSDSDEPTVQIPNEVYCDECHRQYDVTNSTK